MRVKRTRAERLALQRHVVKCWQASDRAEYNMTDKTLRYRARFLVRHCLGKPVTADG